MLPLEVLTTEHTGKYIKFTIIFDFFSVSKFSGQKTAAIFTNIHVFRHEIQTYSNFQG